MKKIVIPVFTIASLLLTTSCSSDDDGGVVDPIEEVVEVVAPETFVFERDGASTVNFSGQSERIAMAEELISDLNSGTVELASLEAMFDHQTGAMDFEDSDLNASTKSVRSKVASSEDFFPNDDDGRAIKVRFDDWIKEQVNDVFPNFSVDAEAGVAGKLQQAGGGSTRYITGKGVELNQVVTKSLIGAMMTDQIVNHYLGEATLDAGTNIADNDANTPDKDGVTYTTMEHKWDEAYGYLYGAEENEAVPVTNADNFLSKYLFRVDNDPSFTGISADVFDAYKLGRAAIVAKNYEVRDEQAAILREKISQVIAVRAVYYLEEGRSILEADGDVDFASAFHALSEGLGFVYSLQFTRKGDATPTPYFTNAEVEAFFSRLLDGGNGLWEASTPETLESIAIEIASQFDFTVEEAADILN